jgi:hypothetical protein
MAYHYPIYPVRKSDFMEIGVNFWFLSFIYIVAK